MTSLLFLFGSVNSILLNPYKKNVCSVFLSATLGSLEFSLLYEQESNSLHCSILRGKVLWCPL